uniref:Uncharacterized protein n=1 Tax=Candidatus Kentrum sp. SD TaxID=2126332 RepID=A0A450YCR8_9GAMM|nr:MAG: hypothetical protein BECKSD772F_GA0070984_103618 [Candidatus Kentron sp. SD]VFK44045.1 MAG: hypothetical protein BECKSD772E_GA0070983_103220 [Candidatus Kentron sp. SD]
MLGEFGDEIVGRLVRDAGQFLDFTDRDNRESVKMFQNTVSISGSAAKSICNHLAMLFA